jgi:hypothetical protein
MKKLLIVWMILVFSLSYFLYAFSAPQDGGWPPIDETIQGIKTFINGIIIKDPNTASIDPNGLAKFKSCQVNNLNVATLDANSKVPEINTYLQDLSGYVPYDPNSHVADSAIYDKHTNLDANSIGLGVAKDPNFAIKGTNFSIDPNGVTVQAGLTTVKRSVSLGDDATVTLPTVTTGAMLKVWTSAQYAEYFLKSDGTVEYIRKTSGATDADNDTYVICVYDGGSTAILKNRSGGTLTYGYILEFN